MSDFDKLYRIKKLKWDSVVEKDLFFGGPSEICYSRAPLESYSIFRKIGDTSWSLRHEVDDPKGTIIKCDSLAQAKRIAEEHYETRLKECLEEVPFLSVDF